MEKLKDYRKMIDELDKEIMTALDKRMEIAKEIGKVKVLNNLNSLDETREKEVLKQANNYQNSKEIKNIYREIFKNSKKLQDYKYFLIGKNLNYSYSPKIYELLGLENYNLFRNDNFKEALKIDFLGINITNPYKYDAYKACDELDISSQLTGVVNTIIKKDGKLVGFNTDFFGFDKLINYHEIDVKNKNVIIVGNGATATTIQKVLEQYNPKNIIKLVRNLRDENEYPISEYLKFKDYEIIINATPYGTYPNFKDSYLFSLDKFTKIEVLIDVIYNPKNTPLLLSGNKNIKKVNGLMMLVSQAAKAASLYLGEDKTELIEEVYKKLNLRLTNIVLIGMPYSGKSTIGLKLSEKLSYTFIDLDEEMKNNQHDLNSILKMGTEADFRRLEVEYANKVSSKTGQIISTGGGIVTSSIAMNYLKRNGLIVFLDEKLEKLIQRIDDTRPLIKNKEDLVRLYNERKHLYLQYSDLIIEDIEIDEVVAKLNEYINN